MNSLKTCWKMRGQVATDQAVAEANPGLDRNLALEAANPVVKVMVTDVNLTADANQTKMVVDRVADLEVHRAHAEAAAVLEAIGKEIALLAAAVNQELEGNLCKCVDFYVPVSICDNWIRLIYL